MIEILSVLTKDTRAFGWVQDSSSIKSLCDVVSVFDSESDFHKKTAQGRRSDVRFNRVS